jgi:hypothetical protein
MRDQDYLTIIRLFMTIRAYDLIRTILNEMRDQYYLTIIRLVMTIGD